MNISERNLQDTCGFLVNDAVRKMKDGQTIAIIDREYDAGQNSLRGLSLLLVGQREKRHIADAVTKLKNARNVILVGKLPNSEIDYIDSQLAAVFS